MSKEWKEAKETKEIEGTCTILTKELEGTCTWLTKEHEGTCICLKRDFVGRGKQRTWLGEYKHWCCGETQQHK